MKFLRLLFTTMLIIILLTSSLSAKGRSCNSASGHPITELNKAACARNFVKIRQLVESGADVNVYESKGWLPRTRTTMNSLGWALYRNSTSKEDKEKTLKIYKYLRKYGARIDNYNLVITPSVRYDLKSTVFSEVSALGIAAYGGHNDVFNEILNNTDVLPNELYPHYINNKFYGRRPDRSKDRYANPLLLALYASNHNFAKKYILKYGIENAVTSQFLHSYFIATIIWNKNGFKKEDYELAKLLVQYNYIGRKEDVSATIRLWHNEEYSYKYLMLLVNSVPNIANLIININKPRGIPPNFMPELAPQNILEQSLDLAQKRRRGHRSIELLVSLVLDERYSKELSASLPYALLNGVEPVIINKILSVKGLREYCFPVTNYAAWIKYIPRISDYYVIIGPDSYRKICTLQIANYMAYLGQISWEISSKVEEYFASSKYSYSNNYKLQKFLDHPVTSCIGTHCKHEF